MPILFAIGRVAFVLIFILSGAQTLMDISGTAALIAPKLVIPGFAVDVVRQIEGTAGMPFAQLVTILVGVVEVVCGLLIAFNIWTRLASVLLIIFTAATIYYFHDFWNMTGTAATDNTIHAMKNVSLIGALLVFFVLGSWRPSAMPADGEEAGALRY
jgi:putative oxidoreductase